MLVVIDQWLRSSMITNHDRCSSMGRFSCHRTILLASAVHSHLSPCSSCRCCQSFSTASIVRWVLWCAYRRVPYCSKFKSVNISSVINGQTTLYKWSHHSVPSFLLIRTLGRIQHGARSDDRGLEILHQHTQKREKKRERMKMKNPLALHSIYLSVMLWTLIFISIY